MTKNNSVRERCIETVIPELFRELAVGEQYEEFECPEFFKIFPEMYLMFAKEDLFEKSEHGDLNSVFNTKKAVHCQIDILLWNLGFSEYKELNFRRKLEILQNCGVIAPNILIRLNSIRNYLEHDYQFVKRKKAQELNDIAVLFVQATSRLYLKVEFLTGKYLLETEYGNGKEEVEVLKYKDKKKVKMYLPSGSISIDRENQMVIVEYSYSYKRQLKTLNKIILKKNYDEFCKWIYILMKAQTLIF